MVFALFPQGHDRLVVLTLQARYLVAKAVVDDVLDLKLLCWHGLWLHEYGLFVIHLNLDVYHTKMKRLIACYIKIPCNTIL